CESQAGNVGWLHKSLGAPNELGEKYQGGVLLIDELDATFHPFSQVALLQRLIKYAEELKIQIVATTHSMFLLKVASREYKKSIRLLFLNKRDEDGQVCLLDNISYEDMEYRLSLISERHKIKNMCLPDSVVTLFEDEIAAMFFNCVTKNMFKSFITIYNVQKGKNNDTALSNSVLSSIARHIATKKIPQFAEVIYVMDGDSHELLNKKAKNLLCLPGKFCVEREVYTLLQADDAFAQKGLKMLGISRHGCFLGFNDIGGDPLLKNEQMRKAKYKAWFASRKDNGEWGRACAKVFNLWCEKHKKDCRKFCEQFLVALQSVRGASFAKIRDSLNKKICVMFPDCDLGKQ
ncbi:MAG: AAA family ATPase, partial [bacterium]|nr:AAA family ATPase [bacterium]